MKKRILFAAAVLTACIAMVFQAFADYDSETVRQVQQALNDAGFDCGTPDGQAGPMTAGAISAYEEANGLTVDGQITEDLLNSLGIAAAAEEGAQNEDETSSSGEENFTAAESMSEVLYAGKWVMVGDEYEIYIPEVMEAGPINDFIEATQRRASLLYGRIETETPNVVVVAGTIGEYLGEEPYSETKIAPEEIDKFLAEAQADETTEEMTINGITGYYREGFESLVGKGYVTFISADPSCDMIIRCSDQSDGYYGQWTENAREYCRNIILSLRKAEKPEGTADPDAAETVQAAGSEAADTEELASDETVSGSESVSEAEESGDVDSQELDHVRTDGLYCFFEEDENGTSKKTFLFYEDGVVINEGAAGVPNEYFPLKDRFNREVAPYTEYPGSWEMNGSEISFTTVSKNGTVDYKGRVYEGYMIVDSHSNINGFERKGMKLDFYPFEELPGWA